jgi:hypothetical protein
LSHVTGGRSACASGTAAPAIKAIASGRRRREIRNDAIVVRSPEQRDPKGLL